MQPDTPSRLTFGIAVQGAPLSSQAPATAFRFARAALQAGHVIHRVFFYHDGVHVANRLAALPGSEASPRDDWVELAERHGIELAVCITSCLKRGLLEGNAGDAGATANIHSSFVAVGLGQLAEMALTCDRVVTFAA
jgi:tRNA 2-thiouridine synthesizing protein D